MAERTGIVSSNGNPLTLLGNPVAVGDKAPDFTALDNGLAAKKLNDYAGQDPDHFLCALAGHLGLRSADPQVSTAKPPAWVMM